MGRNAFDRSRVSVLHVSRQHFGGARARRLGRLENVSRRRAEAQRALPVSALRRSDRRARAFGRPRRSTSAAVFSTSRLATTIRIRRLRPATPSSRSSSRLAASSGHSRRHRTTSTTPACGSKGANCPDDAGPDHDYGSSVMLLKTTSGKDILVAGQKSGVVYGLDPDEKGKLRLADARWQGWSERRRAVGHGERRSERLRVGFGRGAPTRRRQRPDRARQREPGSDARRRLERAARRRRSESLVRSRGAPCSSAARRL